MLRLARFALLVVPLTSACSSRGSESSAGMGHAPARALDADVLAPLRAIPAVSAALVRASRPQLSGERLLLDVPARAATPFVATSNFSASLPARGDGAVRVVAGEDLWLEIRPQGRADVPAKVVERSVVFAAVEPHVDVVLIGEPNRVEELRVLLDGRASNVARYRITKGAGIAQLRLREGVVEALDARGNARLRSEPVVAWDADGRSVPVSIELRDEELVVRADPQGHPYPIVVDPAFGPTGGLTFARRAFTTTTLASGKIMVIGGETATTNAALSTTEIYDPATGTFTLAASMSIPRVRHVAVASGATVFVAGGSNTLGGTNATELYTESTDSWISRAPSPGKVSEGVGVRVPSSGKILVATGRDFATIHGTGNLWDPGTNSWSAVPGSITARYGAAAVALTSTKVLVCGGNTATSCTNASTTCDIYEATTNTWTAGTPMATGRMNFPLAAMAGGRFLAPGGATDNCGGDTNATEYYDDTSSTWAPAGIMSVVRVGASAAAINGGAAVIVFGGSSTAQRFDATSLSWSSDIPLAAERAYGGAATVPNGMIAIAGGTADGLTVTPTVDRYGAGFTNGTPCGTTNAWCQTGFCVEGVCCDTKCGSPCESCTVAGAVGTCTIVNGSPIAPRSCPGTGLCAGTCTGSATCTMPTTAATCIPPTCGGGVAQPPAFCDGAGACGATPATVACTPYVCGATGCKTVCAADSDCISTHFCEATACVPKKAAASACTTDGGCLSGFCADGVCCNEACTAGCVACNINGSEGVCSPESPCSDAGAPDAGSDGASDTTITDSSATDAAIAADTAVAPTDTGLGVAETPAPVLPATPLVSGEFQRCTRSSECSTGFCVDGVCCDSACDDRCHSCALLSAPGKCTLSPIGVDLRNDCGPANQCLGTCGGNGECIGSGSGTMCGRNRCVGPSKGVGPAYCPAPGATCALDQAVPFDCSPYSCEPAFGACRTTCSTTDDCANGFVCDAPSRACIKPEAPTAEEGGCSYVSSRGARGSFGLLALAVSALAMRRRRAPSR